MTTELVAIDAERFPALTDGANIGEVITANMAGEQPTEADLLRIKVPSGGGTAWTVPDPNGEEKTAQNLDGILVHICRRRAYWPDVIPTGEPPMCVSSDCIVGVGEPGGLCEVCPNNQFGSAVKPDGTQGRGKACKERKLLFLLREGRTLPDVVCVPAGSLKAMRQWQLQLGVPYFTIATQLTLAKTRNQDGIEYTVVVPSVVGLLSPEVTTRIRTYAQELQAVFNAVQIDREETETEEV